MRLRGVGGSVTLRPSAKAEPLHEDLQGVERAMSGSTDERKSAIPSLLLMMERGKISPESAQRILGRALDDPEREVRWSAIIALSLHGSKMLDGLCMGLMNEDEAVKGMSAAMIHLALARNPGLLREFAAPLDKEAQGVASVLFYSLLEADRGLRKHSLSSLCALAERSPLVVLDELGYFRRDVLQGMKQEEELSSGLDTIEEAANRAISMQAKRNPV